MAGARPPVAKHHSFTALRLRGRAARVRHQVHWRWLVATAAATLCAALHLIVEAFLGPTGAVRILFELVGAVTVAVATVSLAWRNVFWPALRQVVRSPYFVIAAVIVVVEGYRLVMYNAWIPGLTPESVQRACGRNVTWEPLQLSPNTTLPATTPPPQPFYVFYFVAFAAMCMGTFLLDVQIVPFRRLILPLLAYMLVAQALRYFAAVFDDRDTPLACLFGSFIIRDRSWQRTASVQTGLIVARAGAAALFDPSSRYSLFVHEPMRPVATVRRSPPPSSARLPRVGPEAGSRSQPTFRERLRQRRIAKRVYAGAGLCLLSGVVAFFASSLLRRFSPMYYVAIVIIPVATVGGTVLVSTRFRLAVFCRARPWANQNVVVAAGAAALVFACDMVAPATPVARFFTVAFAASVCAVLSQDWLDPFPPRWLRAATMLLICSMCGLNAVLTHFRTTPVLYQGAGSMFTVDDLRSTAYVSIITMALRATLIAVFDKHSDGALFAFHRKRRLVFFRQAIQDARHIRNKRQHRREGGQNPWKGSPRAPRPRRFRAPWRRVAAVRRRVDPRPASQSSPEESPPPAFQSVVVSPRVQRILPGARPAAQTAADSRVWSGGWQSAAGVAASER